MENKPLTERERIDALVFRLGISIRQLAKIVDMNENTFYHITDNSRFGISERTASKICYNLEKKMSVVVNRQSIRHLLSYILSQHYIEYGLRSSPL